MNPASAASAVEVSNAISGIALAGIVLMAIIIVILALALVKHRHPGTIAGKIATAGEGMIEGFARYSVEMRAFHDGTVEKPIADELREAAEAVYTRLTDTSAEDAVIASANATKTAKRIALENHVAALQAALAPKE